MLRSSIRIAACTVALHFHSGALAQSDCTWGLITPNGPAGSLKTCPDLNTGKTILYRGTFKDHTWEWNGESWVNLEVQGPPPHDGSVIAPFVAAAGEPASIIMFGGITNDTWKWDGQAWTQVATTGPSPRVFPAMAFDPSRHRIVLFGGILPNSMPGHDPLGDTWEWDGSSWTQVATDGPAARWGASMAFGPESQMVLFGGALDSAPWDTQTWRWDGKTWTILAPPGPPARYRAQMGFDAVSNKLVVFSGWFGGIVTDTWEWDGKSWQPGPPANSSEPQPRLDAGFSFDHLNNRLLMTAGKTLPSVGPILSDSHHYSDCVMPANSQCQNAAVLLAGQHDFTTNGAGVLYGQTSLTCGPSASQSITGDIWYMVPAQCTGTLTISLCDADFDSVLAVYPPLCSAVANAPIACGDNECGDDPTVTLPVEYGDAFLIRIAGANGERGSGTMVITCTEACPADLVPNWVVDVDDLLVVINAWGECELGVPCAADIAPTGGNGVVDVDDLLAVINAWGECP